jgi:outer membrane protein assembly factor BamB
MMYMREFMAFDAKTGAMVWRQSNTNSEGVNYATGFYGSFAAANVGGTPVFMDPNGDILRAADGKILFSDPQIVRPQQIPSPVLDNGVFYEMTIYAQTLFAVTLPAAGGDKIAATVRSGKIPLDGFPDYYLPWHTASPLVHDGLVYLYNNSGLLSVVDAATLKVVYQKLLDVDHFQYVNEGAGRGIGISPSLAGNHIYFFGDAGACVVIEPGRTFKQIAKNKIENVFRGRWSERPERTVANPFFDGNRIYWRGESGLWCMGEK